MKQFLVILLFALPLAAQPKTFGGIAQPGAVFDNALATLTKIVRHVSADPGTCVAGEAWFNTTSNLLNVCGPTNTVTALGAGGSGSSGPTPREFPAAVCQSAAGSLALNAASTTSPVPDCAVSGTAGGVLYGVAKFADTATYSLQSSLLLPGTLTSIAAQITWRTAVANTGLNAVWQLQTACVADNESDDPTWNTAQTVTSAAKSAANRLIAASIGTVTITGCAAGETLFWQISRDPAHASDTLAGTAELKSVTFTIQ